MKNCHLDIKLLMMVTEVASAGRSYHPKVTPLPDRLWGWGILTVLKTQEKREEVLTLHNPLG